MDNLTHSLIGAALGQAGLKRKTGLAMPALIIGANLPDIDAGCAIYGIESLSMRRGITHGPIALVLLPLVLAGALWWFDRWQARRGKRPDGRLPVRFGWLVALSFIACLTHPLFDWFNNYGIRLLEPFSSRWFYGDTLFIIDVWLLAILALGVAVSMRLERDPGYPWRRPAVAALLVAATYIALNVGISRYSESEAQFHAHRKGFPPNRAIVIANPTPGTFWERDLIFGRDGYWFRHQRLAPHESISEPLPFAFCDLSGVERLATQRPDLKAFLFWSRAPFGERAADGSVIVRDARFIDPRIGDRFSVALEEFPCRPLPERVSK